MQMILQDLLLFVPVTGMLLRYLWGRTQARIFGRYDYAHQELRAKGEEASQQPTHNTRLTRAVRSARVKTLDSKFLPRGALASTQQSPAGKRLIFIGDIHGCMNELQDLLRKCRYQRERDHLIALGDVVNKGPQSIEVLDFLIAEAATCVQGNHDEKILSLADLSAHHELKSAKGKAGVIQRNLARSLGQRHLTWLRDCPAILRVGNFDKFGDLVAVHAGLVPGVELEAQDPEVVMNMRSVSLLSHRPSAAHAKATSIPWYIFWNRYQRSMRILHSSSLGSHLGLAGFRPTTVVYGHDAKSGLQMHQFTKGLDSGCANGKQLTAWIVADHGHTEVVQVPSKNRRTQNKG